MEDSMNISDCVEEELSGEFHRLRQLLGNPAESPLDGVTILQEAVSLILELEVTQNQKLETHTTNFNPTEFDWLLSEINYQASSI
ncbi:hypothetical protein CHUAL_013721 [Chamberlinius hualienensis]